MSIPSIPVESSAQFRLLLLVIFAFLAFWGFMLHDCLRRRDYWPLLGSCRATRFFWIACMLCANPALTLLYCWVGRRHPSDKRARQPWLSLSGLLLVTGFFVNLPGLTHLWMAQLAPYSPLRNSRVAAHQSKTSSNGSWGNSSDSSLRKACRRIAILVNPEEGLGSAVAKEIQKSLKDSPDFNMVELYSLNRPPVGGLKPDQYFRILVAQSKVLNLPYLRYMKAEVVLEGGAKPVIVNHSYGMPGEIPLAVFHAQCSSNYEGWTSGWESTRGQLAVESIAAEFVKSIQDALLKPDQALQEAPQLPDAFYPRYASFNLPAPLNTLPGRTLGSFHAALIPNESFWQLEVSEGTVDAILDRTAETMRSQGWSWGGQFPGGLFMRRESAFLYLRAEACRPSRSFMAFDVDHIPNKAEVTQLAEPRNGKVMLEVHYRDCVPARQAIRSLRYPQDLDALLWLCHLMDDDQRRDFLKRIEDIRPTSGRQALSIARMFMKEKCSKQARRFLNHAWTWWHLEPEYCEDTQAMQAFAKELDQAEGSSKSSSGQESIPELSVEALIALGAHNIKEPSRLQAFEVKLGEPTLFFHAASGKLHAIGLRILPDGKLESCRTLRVYEKYLNGGHSIDTTIPNLPLPYSCDFWCFNPSRLCRIQGLSEDRLIVTFNPRTEVSCNSTSCEKRL